MATLFSMKFPWWHGNFRRKSSKIFIRDFRTIRQQRLFVTIISYKGDQPRECRMPLIFLETRVEKLDAAMIDGLLEAFFSISQHMAQEGQKHCLCWWDKKTDGWNFYNVANAMQLEEVYAHVFQSMFFSQGNATIDSFEKERKEQFSEVIYITEYWNEKQAVFDDWNLTLLLERREARKEEGEALVPYIFSAETMGEDIDRILTAYRSADYGA